MPPWDTNGNKNTNPANDFLGTTDNQPLSIRTNNTERVRVAPDGAVRIGWATPRPTTGLEINMGDENKTALQLSSSGLGWGSGIKFHNTAPGNKTYGIYSGFGRLNFADVNQSVDRIVIHSSGRIGFGTTDPRAGLEINKGSTNDLALLLISSGPGWGSGMQFHNTAAGGKKYGIYSGFGRLNFTDVDGSVDRMVIHPSGRIGVGTLEPTARLEVAGDIRANDVILNSDARSKTDITRITGALRKLQNMRGVTFAWSPNFGESPLSSTVPCGAGVIAQEVEGVFPELVNSRGEGGNKGVNYGGLTGVLVEACKELKHENDTLRERIDALEGAMAGSL